jgi:hypothetical protein
MAAHAHDHDHDRDHGEKKQATRRRGPVGEQVVESMAGSGRMPEGVRLGGQFDPQETAADEVARRVMQQRPAGDDASIISAARRAGASVPGDVRIHQGGRANQAAASMQAAAFTVGKDVYLTDDAVRTPEQRVRVLAHELTHTGQDRGHGRAPGGEPVVQRLWNPFKKKTPGTPVVAPKDSEEEADKRHEGKQEEIKNAFTDAPQQSTDLIGNVGQGMHDNTANKLGSDSSDPNWKGPERGTDGWNQDRGALSHKSMDDWASGHKSDAANMQLASTVGSEAFGDIGGGIFSGLDARSGKDSVDRGLAGTKAGLFGAKGLTDLTSMSIQASKISGHSALNDSQSLMGQGAMDHASGWLGGLTGGVGMAQDLKSWGSDTVDWFKGKRNFEKVKTDPTTGEKDKLGMAKQVGLSMGRGLGKLGSAGNKGVGAVSKMANLSSQIAHSAGNMSVAGNAASVGGALAHTLAPLQMALGGVDVLKGGYNMYRKGQHRKKLTELKGKRDATNSADKQQIDALDHLTEIAKKKQVRQGINMATGAAGVLGGALTVSGFGALPGAIIGGSVGAFKLGQLGVRKGKQKGRDWADKYNQKDDKDKSWLGKKMAGMFDTSKTTEKKQARYEQTADTLMAMSGQDQEDALKTLGIHDYANVDAADRKQLIVEKLKKRS